MRKVCIKRLMLVGFFLVATLAYGQDQPYLLDRAGFLSILRNYHPVLRQADLQVERAEAGVLQARGAFDPKIEAGLNRKTFDGRLYYSYFNPRLTIPTWYGIDIKAGAEEIVGDRVSTEATTGQNSYIGLNIPANALFFDSRRAALRQAQSMYQLSEAERSLLVNDLIYTALNAYWNWVQAFQVYNIIRAAVEVNETRIRYVVTEYEQGFRPAIDTTEALTQLQGLYLKQNEAWLKFQNAGLELSNYLWLDRNQPFQWNSAILPPDTEILDQQELPDLESLLTQTLQEHPRLQAIRYETDILEVSRRLAVQQLQPKLSINANLLSKGYGLPEEISLPFLENNYKLGIDLRVPLFFRESRGALQSAKIKLQEIDTEQEQLSLQLMNKVKALYNKLLTIQQQIQLFERRLDNNQKLFQGERIRFEAGESTLFLLNTRENAVLETTQELTALRAEWQKNFTGLIWAAGQLE